MFSFTQLAARTKKKFLRSLSLSLQTVALSSTLVFSMASHAEVSVMVAIDPSAPREVLSGTYNDITSTLSKSLGQPVRVTRSANFADVLRSTRTGEYDIYIVPGHVAASALTHGYALIGSTNKEETFVLVSNTKLASPADMKTATLYLAQEDSIYTYMAKGLLNEASISMTEVKRIQYGTTSGAGLVAIAMGMADATVTRKAEYEAWIKTNPGKARVLVESKAVPAGVTVLLKPTMVEPLREKLLQWTSGPSPTQAGLGQLNRDAKKTTYTYVGGLGHFTPLQLTGVQRVTAEEAAALIKTGAQMVDVRSEKEYKAKHIPGAVWAAYIEKSAKETTFSAPMDDFSALSKLDNTKPAIFGCNGAECWKSYKASKVATEKGFKTVYWLRGGLPEWEERGMPTNAN